MHTVIEVVKWWWLLRRARRDPAKFVRRAAARIWQQFDRDSQRATDVLFMAASYVQYEKEVPRWLFGR